MKATRGHRSVGDVVGTMNAINESSRKVATLIREISAACRDQTTGIEEVNLAIGDIDRTTQQNAALVEQAAAAAESMSEQARKLTAMVSVFTV